MLSSQRVTCLRFLHNFLLKLPETCRLMETVSSSRGLFALRGRAFVTAVMVPVSATRSSVFKGALWQKAAEDLQVHPCCPELSKVVKGWASVLVCRRSSL